MHHRKRQHTNQIRSKELLKLVINDKKIHFRKSYESYARAVVDVTPSPYDTEALPLHAGDLIGVIHKVNLDL